MRAWFGLSHVLSSHLHSPATRFCASSSQFLPATCLFCVESLCPNLCVFLRILSPRVLRAISTAHIAHFWALTRNFEQFQPFLTTRTHFRAFSVPSTRSQSLTPIFTRTRRLPLIFNSICDSWAVIAQSQPPLSIFAYFHSHSPPIIHSQLLPPVFDSVCNSCAIIAHLSHLHWFSNLHSPFSPVSECRHLVSTATHVSEPYHAFFDKSIAFSTSVDQQHSFSIAIARFRSRICVFVV